MEFMRQPSSDSRSTIPVPTPNWMSGYWSEFSGGTFQRNYVATFLVAFAGSRIHNATIEKNQPLFASD